MKTHNWAEVVRLVNLVLKGEGKKGKGKEEEEEEDV
jgi:hypothetical protein